MSAATNALRRDPGLDVIAFERGEFTSYSACGIPYFVGGLVDAVDDLVARSPESHRANGIDVRTNTDVVGIDLDPRELALAGGRADAFDRPVLTTAGELAARHVGVAVGVRPDVELAAAAGLRIGPTGALAVDDHQRCAGADGVWAAGDCVESRHLLLDRPVNIQLGTHANKQGRVAGHNAAGGDLAFPGVVGTAISRLCRREVALTGLTETLAAEAGYDAYAATIETSARAGYYPGNGPVWVKLVAERGTGRVLGAQIVGAETAAKRIDSVAMAVWTGMAVDELQWVDLGYAPPVSGVLDPVLVAARVAARRKS